ncbi:PTS system, glucose-specific IIC component [Liquorilactobacillus sucicola DSM 21376 = JCM 15457]|nr:glucose PTS transporter subunit IIA [Liquorilactobacillus sucicola]GAJ26227.1 PTS system, glucose-specific IIC component [Liquorilactobacillus sucicola DSM 21376 = JCM 15457]
MKAYSISALLSIFFAGITEPAIYGIGVKYKKPLIGAVIGGAVGGAFIGGLHVKAFAFVFGGLTTLPAFVGSTFVSYIIGLVICFAVALIVTLVIGIDEVESTKVSTDQVGNAKELSNEVVLQPLDGHVADIAEANDPAFASGSMGQGMVIYPTNGKVYAPFDGTITMLFKTNHAIGITSKNGTELLIHIGIDTVKLNGKHFFAKVKQGETVKAGQLLIQFDLNGIEEAGYDTSTFVIVTNSGEYKEVSLIAADDGSHGREILQANI